LALPAARTQQQQASDSAVFGLLIIKARQIFTAKSCCGEINLQFHIFLLIDYGSYMIVIIVHTVILKFAKTSLGYETYTSSSSTFYHNYANDMKKDQVQPGSIAI